MASTSGVAEAATRSLLMSIRRRLIHCCSMYVNKLRSSVLPQRPMSSLLDVDGLDEQQPLPGAMAQGRWAVVDPGGALRSHALHGSQVLPPAPLAAYRLS